MSKLEGEPEGKTDESGAESKKATRCDLITLINSISPEDNKGFHKVVSAVLDSGFFTEHDFCKIFSVNRSTLVQWRNGTLAPDIDFRRRIFGALLKVLESSKR